MNINILQNIVLDKGKLGGLIKSSNKKELEQLLGVGESQISHLRYGTRKPTADGLLRLMMLYGLKAEDLAVLEGQ